MKLTRKFKNKLGEEATMRDDLVCFQLIAPFLDFIVGEYVPILYVEEDNKSAYYLLLGDVAIPIHHGFENPHIFRPVRETEFNNIVEHINKIKKDHVG